MFTWFLGTMQIAWGDRLGTGFKIPLEKDQLQQNGGAKTDATTAVGVTETGRRLRKNPHENTGSMIVLTHRRKVKRLRST